MTDEGDLPEQFVFSMASSASVYHTQKCLSYERAENDPMPISDSKLEWHELPLCPHCDDDVEVDFPHAQGVADD